MPPGAVASATYRVWVEGQEVSSNIVNDLETITVEDNLYLPDTFAIRLRMRMIASSQGNSGSDRQNNAFRWLDDPTFRIGKSVKIKLTAAPDSTVNSPTPAPASTSSGDPRLDHLIDGEITSLEVDMEDDATILLTVRGFDRSHLLQQGTQVRTFVQMSYSDIVKKIGQEAGLQVGKVKRTSDTYPYVIQSNQTNLEFLQQRAGRIGYELFVDGKDLHFRPREAQAGNPIELKPGRHLLTFHARQNNAGDNIEVQVRGWDPLENREVLGRARPNQANATHIPPESSRPSGSPRQYQFARPVTTQAEADQVAQSLLDYISGNYMQMEGSAHGDQRMRAGTWIELKGFGGQFNGKYYLTSTTHVFSNGRGGRNAGYVVEFKSEGSRTGTLLEAAGGISGTGKSDKFGINGAVPAIVTNINDPENLGRVKVRWPHLDPNVESTWARVISPHHGMMLRPAVNQEVLTVFEDGDMNKPYVIGALWNGNNAPPSKHDSSDHIDSADSFIITTENCALALSEPDKTVGMYIKDGPSAIVTDEKALILANFKSPDDCKIMLEKGSHKITVKNNGDVEIDSMGKVTFKALQDVSISGMNVDISANAQLTIKGAMVKIN